MGEFSIIHWLIVVSIILLLFGSGKIVPLLKNLAAGIKSFKEEMKDK